MHHCIGAGCEFCEWRKKNPIHLGWEYLFPASATSAESADFIPIDGELEFVLTQVETQVESKPARESSLPRVHMQSKQPLDPVSQSEQLHKLTGVVRFGLIGRRVETRNCLWEKKSFVSSLKNLPSVRYRSV